MRRLQALLVASFLIYSILAVTAYAQTTKLQPDAPIERELGAHQVHNFSIDLKENYLLKFVVEQKGIDVIVHVFAPDGKNLVERDSPNGADGPEDVSFVALVPGSYSISVGPLDPDNATTGRYQIKILELREASEQELKASKNLESARAKGVALLLELDGPIQQIKSPQTRIKAQLQAANLLEEIDEKRAAKYLADAVTVLKEFIASVDPNSEQYIQKYNIISSLRFELVQVLAVNDPEAALNFIYSTVPPQNPVGNPREYVLNERNLELTVTNQIIANDPKRAFQLAQRTLKQGYSSSLVATLSLLSQKDPQLGSQLAGDVAGKLLNEKLLKNPEAANLAMSLVRFSPGPTRNATEPNEITTEKKTHLISDNHYRELLQKLVSEVLSLPPGAFSSHAVERHGIFGVMTGLQTMGPELDKIVAGAAAAIRKKQTELSPPPGVFFGIDQQFRGVISDKPVDAAVEGIEKTPIEVQEYLYLQLANRESASGDIARARQIIERLSTPHLRRQALANLEQQEIHRAMNKGRVEDALRSIGALRTNRERGPYIAQIANQIGDGFSRQAALNLLEQARGLLSPSIHAPDQEQMNGLLELARGFSRYDSKRAFEIVEPLIDQFNEISAAARTLEGFGPEYYEDDELNLENGSSVANIAGTISHVLGTLSLGNFERAKQGSERIRLPEVRVKAQLDIAQQAIDGGK